MAHIEEKLREVVERLNSDPELQALADNEEGSCSVSTTMAAAGVAYTLQGVDVPPPSVMHLVALDLVQSPVMRDATEAMTTLEAWRSLWAVTATKAKLRPLMGLDVRIKQLEALRDKGFTEAAVLAQIDKAAEAAWSAVDAEAMDMAAKYRGATAQQVADLLLAIISDCNEAWAMVPKSGSKKKAAAHSMATGWRALRTWLTRQAWRLTNRFCGARRSRVSAF